MKTSEKDGRRTKGLSPRQGEKEPRGSYPFFDRGSGPVGAREGAVARDEPIAEKETNAQHMLEIPVGVAPRGKKARKIGQRDEQQKRKDIDLERSA